MHNPHKLPNEDTEESRSTMTNILYATGFIIGAKSSTLPEGQFVMIVVTHLGGPGLIRWIQLNKEQGREVMNRLDIDNPQ